MCLAHSDAFFVKAEAKTRAEHEAKSGKTFVAPEDFLESLTSKKRVKDVDDEWHPCRLFLQLLRSQLTKSSTFSSRTSLPFGVHTLCLFQRSLHHC